MDKLGLAEVRVHTSESGDEAGEVGGTKVGKL